MFTDLSIGIVVTPCMKINPIKYLKSALYKLLAIKLFAISTGITNAKSSFADLSPVPCHNFQPKVISNNIDKAETDSNKTRTTHTT